MQVKALMREAVQHSQFNISIISPLCLYDRSCLVPSDANFFFDQLPHRVTKTIFGSELACQPGSIMF